MTHEIIRPATSDDESTIKRMIRKARLDPTSLKWQNFLVAEIDGDIISIGQVKSYPGCQEIGSLVTRRAYQEQGIASRIMTALEANARRPLYLLCVDKMEPFYIAHGYTTISWLKAPTALKIKLLPAFLMRLFGVRVLVMVKHK